MYLLLLLAQNLPTELQVCPHPQMHQVGVFWGQNPGGLAVSQAKILLANPARMPLNLAYLSLCSWCLLDQKISFSQVESTQPLWVGLGLAVRINKQYSQPVFMG